MSKYSTTSSTLHALQATDLAWDDSAAEPVPAQGLALVAELAEIPMQRAGRSLPLHAYLLLDCWTNNPLAAQLQAEFPEAAKQRCTVPDPLYQGREGDAPCLVPLSAELRPATGTDSLAQSLAQDWFAHWLYAAWQEAQERLVRQHFCAVLVSGQGIQPIAKHLAYLGFQYPPGAAGQPDGAARLFRYQDPRVMQRVWPVLSGGQQSRWLGGVQSWWTLMQPWGPQDSMADKAPAAPAWFKAESPALPDGQAPVLVLSRLMHLEQWHAAHAAPWGNQSWVALASANVPIAQQPDAAAMSTAIALGQRLGLDGQDLEAFIELSWLLPGEEDATHAHARRWDEPRNQHTLEQALHQMRSQPGLRFASAWLSVKPHPERN